MPWKANAHIENIFSTGSAESISEINKNLSLAEIYSEGDKLNYDSALIYLNKALDISLQTNSELYTYKIYGIFAKLLFSTDNYLTATEYNFRQLNMLDEKAKTEPDNIEIMIEYVTLYRNIGISMNLDIEKAFEYFNKALDMLEEINKRDPDYFDIHRMRLSLYNNIGASSLDAGDYEKADYYLEKAINYPVKIDNKGFYSILYNNLGGSKSNSKDLEKSLEYYNRSFNISKELGDKAGMASIYYNLGYMKFTQNKLTEAITDLNKSIELSREVSNIRLELLSTETLSQIYEQQNDFKQANELIHLSIALRDSIAGKDKLNEMARIELHYLLEKQLKESELKQQIIVSEKEQRMLITIIIAMFLFFLLMILFLLNRNLRIKNKKNLLEQKSLTLQNENLELKNMQLKQSLETKTKELNTHMQYLLKKNEFVSSIIENVSDIKDQDPKQIKSTLKNMQLDIESNVWNEFNALFQDLHHDFYSKLYQAHPDLTSNEIRLCAFMRLNMTTKEISSITLQSIKSIEIARTRLRKKLGLSRDVNLSSYLSQF